MSTPFLYIERRIIADCRNYGIGLVFVVVLRVHALATAVYVVVAAALAVGLPHAGAGLFAIITAATAATAAAGLSVAGTLLLAHTAPYLIALVAR